MRRRVDPTRVDYLRARVTSGIYECVPTELWGSARRWRPDEEEREPPTACQAGSPGLARRRVLRIPPRRA